MSKSSKKVAMRLVALDRATETFAMELELSPIDVIELRRLAGLPDDLDTAVSGIELTELNVPKIKEWINNILDFEKFIVYIDEAELPD
jgi:hypothetical protein